MHRKGKQELLNFTRTSTKRKRESEEMLEEQGYRNFTAQDIENANFFLNSIGDRDYGALFKGCLHHTPVSIKPVQHITAQHLKKEINVLNKVHHPGIVLLLGACSEKSCLVYEYMENGTLEDRLTCKGNTYPLPWQTRFRVAWEVASTLNFLHLSKPDPIVHWDLNSQNIWLGDNFRSKIGGMGLAFTSKKLKHSLSHSKPNDMCYMDPEFLRTGRIHPSSDVYSLGIILLQLITAKPPMGVVHIVENAIENNQLPKILDQNAGEWPLSRTLELAKLALKCTEFQRKFRADLEKDVLPKLSRLKDPTNMSSPLSPLPSFICPITRDVMVDPHVAADGFSYEFKSIKSWLGRKKISPMTNLPLASAALFANRALKSAIYEWKSKVGTVTHLMSNVIEGEDRDETKGEDGNDTKIEDGDETEEEDEDEDEEENDDDYDPDNLEN